MMLLDHNSRLYYASKKKKKKKVIYDKYRQRILRYMVFIYLFCGILEHVLQNIGLHGI